jgi:hypothetical protein
MIIIHLMFAKVGSFYRYEAYLIALWILVLGIYLDVSLFNQFGKFYQSCTAIKRLGLIFIAFIFIFPFFGRGIAALTQIPNACLNIYQQQYQMASFLRQYYQGECIAANDVGLINFLAEVRCLDLWGLTNIQVARAMLQGKYNTSAISAIVRENDCQSVVIYDSWFEHYGGAPREWVRIGQWHISNNIVCGDSIVTWYAPDTAHSARLTNAIEEFQAILIKAGGQISTLTKINN